MILCTDVYRQKEKRFKSTKGVFDTMSIDVVNPKLITLYDMRMASEKSGTSVSRHCRTTYRSLRNWEKGDAIPNIVNVFDLLQIYGYSYYQLDFTPFYQGKNRDDINQRLEAAAATRTPVHNPTETFTYEVMRQQSGYPGAAAAELCDVSYRSIRNWEEGKSIPNVVNADDLLRLYGYSFYELDMVPFFKLFEERTRKKKERHALTDSPMRDRLRFEQRLEIQTNTPK